MKSLIRLISVIMLFSVSISCYLPHVSSFGKNHVAIEYDKLLDDPRDLKEMADKKCAKYGKEAFYLRKSDKNIGKAVAHFECR